MIARAKQQRNVTGTQFDSSEFFVRRLEEHEGTLGVLSTRIEESYAQEITLFGKPRTWYLERATMSLRARIQEGCGLV